MRYFILLLLIVEPLVMAEDSAGGGQKPAVIPVPVPAYGAQPNSGYNRLNPNTIQVFDNDFFKDKPAEPEKTATPKGRAYANEPDYNTENRQKALDKCESLRNQNFAKYQDCYKKDMANTKKGIQENYDEVEKKQSIPLRNGPNSLVEEQMKEPSGFRDE